MWVTPRGAETTMDVSADLLELARLPVLTVSSGAKGILDLPKTLEVLETQGVPVIGYGTDTLPAFHSRDSALPIDHRVDTPQEAAALARLHWSLGLAGLLVCNPVPQAAALARQEVEAWIDGAMAQAGQAGIAGKAVTPFLLAKIAEASGGRSLTANKALLADNARVGAEIACALVTQETT